MLEAASLAYLALPWLIFALGWLRAPWAACALAALLLAGVAEWRRSMGLASNPRTGSGLAAVVAVAALWTVLSGAGGVGYQNLDWHKHNLILDDLAEQRWPVDYAILQQNGSVAEPLTYYAAYYLPAAAIGKIAGWTAANDALYLYTAAGALLALLWFARASGGRLLSSALLFVALSGLDVIGWALFAKSPYRPTEHLEWWAGVGSFQYSSNTSLLFWVPQHALGGWIATGLVAGGETRAAAGRVLLVLALVLLWSPFAALGLAPFALLALAESPPRSWCTLSNLVAAPALGALALLFLASRGDPVAHGWLFSGEHPPFGWGTVAAFYALELGALAIVSFPSIGPERRRRWWVAIGLLAVLPLYRVGRFNDLTMRASIPALFVFWTFVARAFWADSGRRSVRRAVFVALVAIGAVTPANEIARALTSYRWATPEVDPRPLLVQDPLYRTYVGDARSWFFRHLARPLREVVTVEAEHPRRDEPGTKSAAEATASAGRVLVVDADEPIRLTYRFEVAHAIREANLAARHRGGHAAALKVAIDGEPRGELPFEADAAEWRFANLRIDAHLAAGWHELSIEMRAPGTAIDAFILIEAARSGAVALAGSAEHTAR